MTGVDRTTVLTSITHPIDFVAFCLSLSSSPLSHLLTAIKFDLLSLNHNLLPLSLSVAYSLSLSIPHFLSVSLPKGFKIKFTLRRLLLSLVRRVFLQAA